MEFALKGSNGKSSKKGDISSGLKLPKIGKPPSREAVEVDDAEVPSGGIKLDPNLEPTTDPSLDQRPLSEGSVQYCNSLSRADGAQPTGMRRAKVWSPEVENAFRFQLAGFRDESEYRSIFGDPELWPEIGLIKCLRAKSNGYFMYFRTHRECQDKHLNKIKIYEYASK